jgi:hypothetical protein
MAQQHQFCRSYNGSQLQGPHNPGVSPTPVAQQTAWPQVLDEPVKKLAHRNGRKFRDACYGASSGLQGCPAQMVVAVPCRSAALPCGLWLSCRICAITCGPTPGFGETRRRWRGDTR